MFLFNDPNRQTLANMTCIEPLFNRLVIFNTYDTTFHGHPLALDFPDEYPRTSLAFYYYTSKDRPSSERRRLNLHLQDIFQQEMKSLQLLVFDLKLELDMS